MNQYVKIAFLMGVSMVNVKSQAAEPQPPVPVKRPKKMTKFGDVRTDPYFWMRERDNPEVLAHLKLENKYTADVLAPTQKIQEEILEEFKSRINENDDSYPYKHGQYYYYQRYAKGLEYPIYARRKGSRTGREEILLDVNEKARGHNYYSSDIAEVSADHKIMVIATDKVGRRFYDLSVVEIESGRELLPPILNVTGTAVLSKDGAYLFYSKQDPETLRSDKVFRVNLKSGATEMIFEEKDETYNVDVGQFRSQRFILIQSSASQENESWLIPSDDAGQAPKLVLKREKNHEYYLDDGGDRFYIRSNKGAKNFKLLECTGPNLSPKNWKTVVPHRSTTMLEDVDVFRDFLVLSEKTKALPTLRLIDRKTGKIQELGFPEKAYSLSAYSNAEFVTDEYLYGYQSMVRPSSIFRLDLKTRESTAVKTKQVPNFSADHYETNRIFIAAKDGAKIPVTLLYKKGYQPDGKSPLFVSAYGSYGYSNDPYFSTFPLSLVDRGFVYAVAHVRGGSDMGRYWYDEGRMKSKKNTFTDFIAVTEGLVKKGWGAQGHVHAEGGSAGGLLMGAIANMRPDLYRGILAQVPFVDVLTTMLDASLPLTTGEYDEWGNPNQKSYYQYIKSYSPYDQVKAQNYPNILITAGLHDSQVQYWEPMKWAAKLRDYNKSSSLILLQTELEAGHSGTTGRYKSLVENARLLGFVLGLENNLIGKK